MTETNYAVPPGHYLQEWLTEHDMSLSDAMRVLPIEPDVLLDLVYGHTPVLGIYAISLAELTGIPVASWLRYETQYQADKARLANTSTPLSNDELNEMSLRVDAATPGPWTWSPTAPNMDGVNWDIRIAGKHGIRLTVHEYEHGYHNAEFIAAARADIPRLIAEVRRLKAKAGE